MNFGCFFPRQRFYEIARALPSLRNTGWKPCYINAVASSLQVHGDSFGDGSGRSLDSLEGQSGIGFQPVFCSQAPRQIPVSYPPSPVEPRCRLLQYPQVEEEEWAAQPNFLLRA